MYLDIIKITKSVRTFNEIIVDHNRYFPRNRHCNIIMTRCELLKILKEAQVLKLPALKIPDVHILKYDVEENSK